MHWRHPLETHPGDNVIPVPQKCPWEMPPSQCHRSVLRQRLYPSPTETPLGDVAIPVSQRYPQEMSPSQCHRNAPGRCHHPSDTNKCSCNPPPLAREEPQGGSEGVPGCWRSPSWLSPRLWGRSSAGSFRQKPKEIPSTGEFPTSSSKLKAAGKLHQDQRFCCWTPKLLLMLLPGEICGPSLEGVFLCGSLRNPTHSAAWMWLNRDSPAAEPTSGSPAAVGGIGATAAFEIFRGSRIGRKRC